jgi:YfiH family protein
MNQLLHFSNHILTYTSTTEDGNLGFHVGDDPKQVEINHQRLKTKLNIEKTKLVYMNQVHSDNVVNIEANTDSLLLECDAMITNQKNTPLLVMVADCIPILLYDPINKAIGVAHAGRNGVFLNIVSKTIKSMQKYYRTDPKELYLSLGPSIHACCYEVSEELAKIAIKSFGKEYVNGRYLDLQSMVKQQALREGLSEDRVEISPICTMCGEKPYYSYRKEPHTGRFGSLIMLV